MRRSRRSPILFAREPDALGLPGQRRPRRNGLLPLAAAAAFSLTALASSCSSPSSNLFSTGTGTGTGAGGSPSSSSTGTTHTATTGTGTTSTQTGTGGSGGSSPAGAGGSAGASAGGAAGSGGGSGCVGLQCQAAIDDCKAKGMPLTTISGVVYDPAGNLPLYNVYVYLPNGAPAPITPGNPTCVQCAAPASGSPILGTATDTTGAFTLSQGPGDMWGVPSGDNLLLVLQVGKWRRQVVLPHVEPCAPNAIPDPATPAQKLRLPANGSEGDMPLIAFTSGCDPAECFLRTIGISDSEFVAPGSPTGHVHFYTGQDASAASGSASMVTGGNTVAETYDWWTTQANLQQYDLVFNACECNVNDRNSALDGGPGNAYAAMDAYLSSGGRLFAEHYYYNWFQPPTGPTDLQGVVDWEIPEGASVAYPNSFIDTTFPRSMAFASWAQSAGVTTVLGGIAMDDTRWDMNQVTAESSRWIYAANLATDTTYDTLATSFNTPTTVPVAQQCGRAVYSDAHLSGTSDDSVFPNECVNPDPGGAHAVNQKALEFVFFDLFGCVQDDTKPPVTPPWQ
jgi:hypothetical protein